MKECYKIVGICNFTSICNFYQYFNIDRNRQIALLQLCKKLYSYQKHMTVTDSVTMSTEYVI